MMYLESINPMSFDSGPGIRVDILLSESNGVLVNCNDVVNRIRKFRPYFGPDQGGVTFRGDIFKNVKYMNELCHLCHKAGINTCISVDATEYNLDKSIFEYLDLIIIDIKSLPLYNYNNLDIEKLMNMDKFISDALSFNVELWIRQEINSLNNNDKYINALKKFIDMYGNIKNIELYSNEFSMDDIERLKEVIYENKI